MIASALVLLAVASTCTSATTLAPSAGPAAGGTLTIALYQAPTSLSPLNLSSTVAAVIADVVFEPLARTDDDGNYVAVLATRVPTLQNGGVRLGADGRSMDVTWELKPGLRWSDGEPITSADLKFTWEAWSRERVAIGSDFKRVSSIDLPDERTAVLHYPSIYAAYALLFTTTGTASTGSLLPKHLLENVSDIASSAYARLPVGMGPFKLTRWTDESVIAERNPMYRTPGRPYLDRIVFKFVESRDKALAQLETGAVDGMWNPSAAQVVELARYPSLKTMVTPGPSVERVEFNLAEDRDGTDPASVHPVLGDLAMRRALVLATPKQEIIDKLLYGKAVVGRAALSRGWAAVKDLAQDDYDPAKARALLDAAGWSVGADGIRRKSGVAASLTITLPPGDDLRAHTVEILADAYRKIGVELTPRTVPIGDLIQGKGILLRGSFDLALFGSLLGVDPGAGVGAYASSNIPSAANGFTGFNINRLRSAEVDRAIAAGARTLDQDERKAAYATVFRAVNDAIVAIWLYDISATMAYRAGVNGWDLPVWGHITWNAAEWRITPAVIVH